MLVLSTFSDACVLRCLAHMWTDTLSKEPIGVLDHSYNFISCPEKNWLPHGKGSKVGDVAFQKICEEH